MKTHELYGIRIAINHEMPASKALVYGDPYEDKERGTVFKMMLIDLKSGSPVPYPGSVATIEKMFQIIVNKKGYRYMVSRMKIKNGKVHYA